MQERSLQGRGGASDRARVRRVTQCALMAALLCLLSPWAIPIGPVPLSLSLAAVLLAGVLLGPWRGMWAVLLYLFLGAIGLPVFGGGMGGFSVLFGPTGGFLWSYPIAAFLAGLLSRLVFPLRGICGFALLFVCLLASAMVCYLAGVYWLTLIMERPFGEALLVGVIPFLPFDLFKCAAVALVGKPLQARISRFL